MKGIKNMIHDLNKSIYSYAKDITDDDVITFYDATKILLNGLNCIVCLESSADIQGYSNGGFRHQIYVYSEKEFNLPYVKCILVESLNKIPFIDFDGIKVSPITNAIIDMLDNDTTDTQVLYETFAEYYWNNNQSYDGLVIPKHLQKKAKHYMEEGILFYEN